MTGRDPTLQEAIDRAAHELARRIRANPDPADVDAFARAYLEDLYGEGWRPWPRSDRIPAPAQVDPDRAHRGAGLARDLLARRTTDPEGPADA